MDAGQRPRDQTVLRTITSGRALGFCRHQQGLVLLLLILGHLAFMASPIRAEGIHDAPDIGHHAPIRDSEGGVACGHLGDVQGDTDRAGDCTFEPAPARARSGLRLLLGMPPCSWLARPGGELDIPELPSGTLGPPLLGPTRASLQVFRN